MNAVEEIYVLSPSVLWSHRQRTYLPEQNWFRTGPAGDPQQHGAGREQQEPDQETKFRYKTVSEQINKETESALAEFDRQVDQFDDVYDNFGLVPDYEEDMRSQEDERVLSSISSTSLCLDTSSLCLESMDIVKVFFYSYNEYPLNAYLGKT